MKREGEDTNENCNETVTNFFSQTMKIAKSIKISHAQRHGNGKPRLMKVTLANAKDKSEIYKCGKNLKGIRNRHDKPYFLNDQLSIEKQEEQRRFRDLRAKNRDNPASDSMNMLMSKGKLLINDVAYKPKIKPPTNREIILPDNLAAIEKLKMQTSSTIKNGKCKFIGMSCEVASLSDVRNGYIKAKRLHPRSLYIVCAFRIPGEEFYSPSELRRQW